MSKYNILENKRRWSDPKYKKRVGDKIRQSLTGRIMSDEIKKKISDSLKGRKTWKKRKNVLKGKNHPNWKGGISPQRQKEYGTRKYKDFVKAVLKRDNYTCQSCGITNGEGFNVKLEVHHIKSYAEYPELRFDVNNGITLCKKCHNKTKKNNKRPVRRDKILVKKICEKCGKEFTKRNPRKYCDECKKTICLFCGKEFILKNGKKEQKFCSRECYGKWFSKNKTKENNPNWKGYKIRKCLNCHNDIVRRENEILTNYNRRKFCCLKCAYDYRKK